MARADVIQLAHGSELIVNFSVPGFNSGNPATIFPMTIGLELAGSVPVGTRNAAVPGSTENYYSGILLTGTLQSLNGLAALPLFNADAWRLGLPAGDIVADATGGNAAMAYADVAVSLPGAEALFGSTGEAEFVIQNLGSQVTIGLGPGYSLSNAILAPLINGNSGVQMAGYLQGLSVTGPTFFGPATVPEPGGLGSAAGCGAILLGIGAWMKGRLAQAIKPTHRER